MKDENVHRYEVRGENSQTFGEQKDQRCIFRSAYKKNILLVQRH